MISERAKYLKTSISYFVCLAPIIFLVFLKNYCFHWDGLSFAWQVENLPWHDTFHKHHLFYTTFIQAVYLFLRDFGFAQSSFQLMTYINIFFGLIYLTLCYLFLRKINPDYAFLTIIFIAFTYTFGNFFRNADAYIIPIAINNYILLRIIHVKGSKITFKVSYLDWFMLLVSSLFHQLSIFLILPLAYASIDKFDFPGFVKAVSRMIIFIFVFILVYLYVFYTFIYVDSSYDFFRWFYGYLGDDYWIFSDEDNIFAILRKISYFGFLNHKALFLAPIEREPLNLYSFYYSDNILKIGRIGGWMIFGYLIYLIIAGICRMFKDIENRKYLCFIVLWIFPYFVFIQIFSSYGMFYGLFYLFPLVILMVKGIESISHQKNYRLILIILLVVVLNNMYFGFVPESFPGNNPYIRAVSAISQEELGESLLMFYPEDYFYAMYIRYFGKYDCVFLMPFDREKHYYVDDREIMENCDESIEWLNSRYEKIYLKIPEERVYNGKYRRIGTLFYERNIPEIMLVDETMMLVVDNLYLRDLSIYMEIDLMKYYE